ncbi:hypothetical protein T484DRAFT_1755761 [Baffinella frigidus]|nr:hypothetical protein T484DRAFT_1755761 [Cryptophyta sp. CCMP2293]
MANPAGPQSWAFLPYNPATEQQSGYQYLGISGPDLRAANKAALDESRQPDWSVVSGRTCSPAQVAPPRQSSPPLWDDLPRRIWPSAQTKKTTPRVVACRPMSLKEWGAICDVFGGTSGTSTRLPQPPRQDVLTCFLRGELDDFQNGRREGTFRGRFRLPSRSERAATRAKARDGRRDNYTVDTPFHAAPFTSVIQPFEALVRTLPYCLPPEATACWILSLTLLQVLGLVFSFFFPPRPDLGRALAGNQQRWKRPPAYPSRPGRGNTPPKRRHAFIARRRLGSVSAESKKHVEPVSDNESLMETTSAYAFAAMLPCILPVTPGVGICFILFLHLTVLARSLTPFDSEHNRLEVKEIDFWGGIVRASVFSALTPASLLGLTVAPATTVFLSSLTCHETWFGFVLLYALVFLASQLTSGTTCPPSVGPDASDPVTTSMYILACVSPSICTWSPTTWLLSLSLVHLVGLMHLLTCAEANEASIDDTTHDPSSADVSRRLLPFSANRNNNDGESFGEPLIGVLSSYALACMCPLMLPSSVPAWTLSLVLIHLGLLMWSLSVPDCSTRMERSSAQMSSAPATSSIPVASKPPAAANATARKRRARHSAASSSRTQDDLANAECTRTNHLESTTGGLDSGDGSDHEVDFGDDNMEEVDDSPQATPPTKTEPQAEADTADSAAGPPVRELNFTTNGIVLDFRNNAISRLSQATAALSMGSPGSHPDWTSDHYLVTLGPGDADTACILRRHVNVSSTTDDVLCVHDLLSADGLEILRPYASWHGTLCTVQGSVLHLQPAYDAPDRGVPAGDLIHLKRCISPLDTLRRDPPNTSPGERIFADWLGINPRWVTWAATAGTDEGLSTSLDTVPRFDRSVTMRLRLAGISEWEHQERIRFHPPGSEERLQSFLVPTPCTNPSSGLPAFCPPPWMRVADPPLAGDDTTLPPVPVSIRSRILRYPASNAAAFNDPVNPATRSAVAATAPTPSSSAPVPHSLPTHDVTPGDTTMVDAATTSSSLSRAVISSRSMPPIPRLSSSHKKTAQSSNAAPATTLPLGTGGSSRSGTGHPEPAGGKAPSKDPWTLPLDAGGASHSGAGDRDSAGGEAPSTNLSRNRQPFPPPADQESESEEASHRKPLYTIVLDPRCGVGSRFSQQVLTDHVLNAANPLQHSRMTDDYCQLQLGSFVGDSLGVYYPASQSPGTITRLSINDLLASDAARITGGTPDGALWCESLILSSGARLPLRPARAEDYPGSLDLSAFRCVDIYEVDDCDTVDSHVIQTNWTSPDPDWAVLPEDSKSTSDLDPFSTEVRARLRDAGITPAEHFSHLRRRDWLNVSPESFPIVKLGHLVPTSSAMGVATSSSSLLLRDSDGASASSSKRSRRGGSPTAGPAKRSQFERASLEPAKHLMNALPPHISPPPEAEQEGADIPYRAVPDDRADSVTGSDRINMENDEEELPMLEELRSTDYLSRCHPIAALEPFPAAIRAKLIAQDENDFMIEYTRARTTQRVLQDYTVLIDGKAWHWHSVRPGEVGSEEHLNTSSGDMVFLQPSDRGVDLQCQRLQSTIRRVIDDLHHAMRHLETNDALLGIPAVFRAYQTRQAAQHHRQMRSADWIRKFLELLHDEGRTDAVSFPYARASLRLKLLRPDIPEGTTNKDGFREFARKPDGMFYTEAERDDHRRHLRRRQARADIQILARKNGEVNYVLDWRPVRELSCVNSLEHFIAYNKTQCEY